MYTGPQMLDRSKSVTRRLRWLWARPGMRVLAVSQCMGLRRGKRAEVYGVIEILSVRREPLSAITAEDCVAEGFPEFTPADFVAMFCAHMKCKPDVDVTRVEFRHVKDASNA